MELELPLETQLKFVHWEQFKVKKETLITQIILGESVYWNIDFRISILEYRTNYTYKSTKKVWCPYLD
jgi:hypothetical protein